ncbi:hypothetical protein [Streptomyces sp. SCL15-6]|uniref:hypothetical protein n=1 Tax=Streptomyces sp. SCL15-6 TaxID=2967222 RepID=UPI0039903634
MTDIEFAWSALGGEPALLRRVTTTVREGALVGRLPARESARSCVGVCALAAAELAARREGLAREPAGAYPGPEPRLAERNGPLGRLRYALPPVSYAGGPADWARPPGPWGTDAATWL